MSENRLSDAERAEALGRARWFAKNRGHVSVTIRQLSCLVLEQKNDFQSICRKLMIVERENQPSGELAEAIEMAVGCAAKYGWQIEAARAAGGEGKS